MVALLLLACGPSRNDSHAGDSDSGVDSAPDTSDSVTDTASDSGQDSDSADTDTSTPPQDADRDGYDTTVDCNDADPAVHPDAGPECDGRDLDCDGVVETPDDVDGDGYTVCTGDCDDAEQARAPGVDEVCGDGLDGDCTPSPQCRTLGEVSLDSSTTYFLPERADEQVGTWMSSAGDMDADGFGDVALASASGELYVLFGGFDPVEYELGRVSLNYSPQSGSTWGQALGSADLNGDGQSDLLMGAYGGGSRGDGIVYAWYTEGATHNVRQLASLGSGGSGGCSGVGAAVAGGDIDGDGLDDMVVGASGCGTVLALRGPATGGFDFGDADLLTASGAGNSLALPGDLDGDGYGDLVLTGTDGLLVAPGPLGPMHVGDTAITAANATEWTVSGGGDIDGDGLAEWTAAPTNASDVDCWIFGDPGVGTWAPEDIGQRIAGTVDAPCRSATSGLDVDGDGQSDLAFASPGVDEGAIDAGAAFLLYGPVTGDVTAGDEDVLLSTGHAGAGIARTTSAGDTNGDGYDDLLVGAPNDDESGANAGLVWVWRGEGE